jgi:hypothetical protein
MLTTFKLSYRKPIIYEPALKEELNVVNQVVYFKVIKELY